MTTNFDIRATNIVTSRIDEIIEIAAQQERRCSIVDDLEVHNSNPKIAQIQQILIGATQELNKLKSELKLDLKLDTNYDFRKIIETTLTSDANSLDTLKKCKKMFDEKDFQNFDDKNCLVKFKDICDGLNHSIAFKIQEDQKKRDTKEIFDKLREVKILKEILSGDKTDNLITPEGRLNVTEQIKLQLEKEYNAENMECLEKVIHLQNEISKGSTNEILDKLVDKIRVQFIEPGSLQEVNLSGDLRNTLLQAFKEKNHSIVLIKKLGNALISNLDDPLHRFSAQGGKLWIAAKDIHASLKPTVEHLKQEEKMMGELHVKIEELKVKIERKKSEPEPPLKIERKKGEPEPSLKIERKKSDSKSPHSSPPKQLIMPPQEQGRKLRLPSILVSTEDLGSIKLKPVDRTKSPEVKPPEENK